MNETKRDLTADLAVCDAATAGPWVFEAGFIFPEDGGGEHIGYTQRAVDSVFIAEARTGWPDAIKLALLRQERISELCDRNAYYIDAAERAEDKALELEADIERLRAHCREVIDLIVPNESEYKCDYRREWALRVLDES